MKHFFSWIIVAQLSFAGHAQELGEKSAQGDAKKIIPSFVEVESSRFHKIIEQEVISLETISVADFISNSGVGSQNDRQGIVEKLGPHSRNSMKFKLKTSGHWEMVVGNQRVLFSSADAFKQRLFINNREYVFKGKTFVQVLSEIQTMDERKTSSLFNLFIQPAYADLPRVSAMAAVVAVVLMTKALHTFFDPSFLPESLSQLKAKFSTDREACENDGHSGRFLNSYFDESNASIFSFNRKVSAAERALRSEMLKKLSAGSKSEMSCAAGLSQGLKAAGFLLQDESMPKGRGNLATLLKARISEVCEAYNGLLSCVNTQVLHFVHNKRESDKLSLEVREVIESRRSLEASPR